MERSARTVYFDNSQLHLLSELRRNDTSRFAAFLEVWSAQNCVLALSQTHLSEINRYDDSVRREARYDLLKALMPIHSDIPVGEDTPEAFLLLTSREIFRALIKQGLLSVEGDALTKFENAFPQQLTSIEEINLLRALPTVNIYRSVLEAFYEANKLGALANSRPTQTNYQPHRLSEIPDTRIDANLVVDILRQLEKDQTSIANLDMLRDVASPEQIAEVFDGLKNTIRDFVKRTEDIGSSNALAEFLGADSTDRTNVRKPIDHLIQQHTFRFSVRNLLIQLCGEQNESTLRNVASKIMLEDCPGTWLKYSVQLQMRKAMPMDDASNYYDLEHLSYVPYVDVLFADKRIATFARQVLNSDQLPSSLDGVSAPVSVPNSIASLESAISSLT